MRYQDLKLTEAELMEINMSPGSLKRLSSNIEALAGMEFEMVVPNAAETDEDFEPEPDYDSDERARSIDDVCEFFHDGDHNSRRTIDELRRRMQNDFEEWSDQQLMDDWAEQGMDQIYEYVKNNVDDDTIIEALELESDEDGNPPVVSRKEWARYAEQCMEEQNDTYDEAYEEFRDDWYNDSDKEDQWLDSEGYGHMSDIENAYNITWPHWHYNNNNENGVDVEFVADDFRQAIGRKVNWSRNYHGGKREPDAYVVEPDGSIDVDDTADGGLEFVSPPLPLSELLSDLAKVKEWANRTGCYTNDSTGLHINVSVPGFDVANLDYVKLALLLGDEHVLEVFGRMGNTYCKSAVEVVKKRVKQNPDATENLLNQMREHLGAMATKAIHSGATDKYTSINTKTGYIEFRSPGGDWLNRLSEGEEIQHTLLRFVVALDAAIKPDLYRQEYLKKLYKLLDVKSEKDTLSHFARFVAGEIPRQALKSFIRQVQLERGVKRGKETGPMWWRVYKEGKGAANGAVIEVVASSREEAIDKAAEEWGVFSDEYRRAMYAEPVRPYDGVDTSKEYEFYDRRSGAAVATFRASDDDAALKKLDQFRAGQVRTQGITVPQANEIYGVRSSRAVTVPPRDRPSSEPIPGSTLDLQRQRAAAAQIPTIDIDVEPAPAPQPAGEFSGLWKVLVNGEEVYRFGGVGNVQSDANRVAADWLRRNGQGVSGEGFEVVPVMIS